MVSVPGTQQTLFLSTEFLLLDVSTLDLHQGGKKKKRNVKSEGARQKN